MNKVEEAGDGAATGTTKETLVVKTIAARDVKFDQLVWKSVMLRISSMEGSSLRVHKKPVGLIKAAVKAKGKKARGRKVEAKDVQSEREVTPTDMRYMVEINGKMVDVILGRAIELAIRGTVIDRKADWALLQRIERFIRIGPQFIQLEFDPSDCREGEENFRGSHGAQVCQKFYEYLKWSAVVKLTWLANEFDSNDAMNILNMGGQTVGTGVGRRYGHGRFFVDLSRPV